MIYSKITGTGSYLPEQILTNADLEEMVDTSDDWIRSRTGIEKRHVARNDETTLNQIKELTSENKGECGFIIHLKSTTRRTSIWF